MNSEEFRKGVVEKNNKDYGLFPPPISGQDGLNVLINHFLGDKWYTVLPMSRQQVNTEAIYEILAKYPKRKPIKDILQKALVKISDVFLQAIFFLFLKKK